jgi:hypothetical protein
MNYKILFFLLVIYIMSLSLIRYRYSSNCEDQCKLQYIGNILLCGDMDLECYKYYDDIYDKCLQNC